MKKFYVNSDLEFLNLFNLEEIFIDELCESFGIDLTDKLVYSGRQSVNQMPTQFPCVAVFLDNKTIPKFTHDYFVGFVYEDDFK